MELHLETFPLVRVPGTWPKQSEADDGTRRLIIARPQLTETRQWSATRRSSAKQLRLLTEVQGVNVSGRFGSRKNVTGDSSWVTERKQRSLR